MSLNIQIDLIILKTDDEQFTLKIKKSLHITFNFRASLVHGYITVILITIPYGSTAYKYTSVT